MFGLSLISLCDREVTRLKPETISSDDNPKGNHIRKGYITLKSDC